MSASRERKKRLELAANGQSPKQLKAAAEKKRKKKNTTIGIIVAVVVAAILIGCLYFLVIRPNTQPRRTVAATVGDHELSATDLSYYYYDSINTFYQNYGAYLSYLLPDASAPIGEQVYDEESGKTWADYFMEGAAENAKQDYAVYDAAKADGYTISAEGEQSIKDALSELESSVKDNGYKSMKQYLTTVYGKGATEQSFYNYQLVHSTAAEYAQKIDGERTYTAEQIQAKDDENPNLYTNVNYRAYYISSADYKEESAVDEAVDYVEEGDEDAAAAAEEAANEAALAAAEEAAGIMAAQSNGKEDKYLELTVEYADEDSKEGYENPDATLQTNMSFDNIPTYMRDWLYDASRKEGDTGIAFDGNSGYYVMYFLGLEKNDYNMVDVRQILFQPEVDEDVDGDGTNDTSSDEAKAKAKADAEALLAKWQSGEATEDSFAALSDEQTGGTDGGLYADIYHGMMGVESFENWCFDASRKPGDAEVVETEYGYHVIYFVGTCDNYRESMIIADLKEADYDAWNAEVTEGYDAVLNEAGTKLLRTDLVLGSDTNAAA